MTIVVEVGSRLRMKRSEVGDDLAMALRSEFTYSNPMFHKLKAMGRKTWSQPAEIETWDEEDGVLGLPRGGLRRMLAKFSDAGVGARFVDQRVGAAHEGFEHKRALRDYQERVVCVMLERENCLMRSGTGSGKTTAAIGLIARAGQRALVIVPSVALLSLWQERLELEMGLGRKDVGLIQGKRLDLKPVTVATQQTLWRLKGVARGRVQAYFGMVILDEVHKAGAATFAEVIDWMPARYRVGFSDSERRKDGKHFLVYDQFGEVAVEVTDDELVGYHTHAVELLIVPTKAKVGWYNPREESFDPLADEGERPAKETPNFNKLIDALGSDVERNEQVVAIAAAEHAAGHSVIVMAHRREHCRLIRSMLEREGIRCGLMLGGADYRKEFEETASALNSKKLRAAVGTIQAVGTGVDLPSVDRGVLATPIANNKQLLRQVRGRICRRAEGKADAALYYLFDVEAFGPQAMRQLARWSSSARVVCGFVGRSPATCDVEDYISGGWPLSTI